MRSANKILATLLLGYLLYPISAHCGHQYPVHNELWTRVYLNHNFSAKFRMETEYQYRWQNNPVNATQLPSIKLAQGARIWLYYKCNTNLTAALSPFCWFKAYPLINSGSDFNKSNTNELRASAGSELRIPTGNVELKGRMIYETRFFSAHGSNEWIRKDRARIRTMLSIPVYTNDSANTIFSVFVANEYFFQGQKLFTCNTFFDQNRIVGGFSWKPDNRLKFEIYYLHILKNSTTRHYIERVIWLNTSITI